MADTDYDHLTVIETARLLGRSTEQVRRYLREGVLRGQRLGGQWFIAREDAEALARRRYDASGRTSLSFEPNPLDATIAIGGSGGRNIAAGKLAYLCPARTVAHD